MSKEKKITRRGFIRSAGTLAAAAALQACAPQAEPTAVPPQATSVPARATAVPIPTPTVVTKESSVGGTFVAAGDGIGDNHMPAAGFQGWTHWWGTAAMYDTLYSHHDISKAPIPALATSSTVSDDGLIWTFQLRKDVKFHDGTPFNAEAVEFNYMRYLDDTHPYYDENAAMRSSILPKVTEVRAKDEFTVEIVREQPAWGFLTTLAVPPAGFMSPTAIKEYGVKDVVQHPVGTGPFVFEKGEKGTQITLTAFDGYWGGRPKLDRVVLRVIAEEQAMSASLLSGEIDMTPFIDLKDLETFRTNPNLNVTTLPAILTGYLGVNQQNDAMKDIRVRRALAHAINKQRIIDVILYGEGDLGGGLTPPPLWAYAPELKDYYPYDPQKAKDLLQEAGGATEFTLYAQTSGFWPRMAELLQADLSAVGFKVTIETIDSARFYGQMSEGQHAVFVADATGNTPDPEDVYWILFGCDNPRSKRWGYCNKEFDDLMARQSEEKDQETRKQIFAQMQKMLLDDVTFLPNYYGRVSWVANKRVNGFNPQPLRHVYLHETYLTAG